MDKVQKIRLPTSPAMEEGTRAHALLENNILIPELEQLPEGLPLPDVLMIDNTQKFFKKRKVDIRCVIQEEWIYIDRDGNITDKDNCWLVCRIDAHNSFDFLVDWKTGVTVPTSHQLDVYAVAFWLKYIKATDPSRPFSCYYYYPKTNKVIEHKYDLDTIAPLRDWLFDAFWKLEERIARKTEDQNDWPSTVYKYVCNMCGFKNMCSRRRK